MKGGGEFILKGFRKDHGGMGYEIAGKIQQIFFKKRGLTDDMVVNIIIYEQVLK